eukprot:Lankesteria_metandrocarpae@DN7329_c0_g1_i1.p2
MESVFGESPRTSMIIVTTSHAPLSVEEEAIIPLPGGLLTRAHLDSLAVLNSFILNDLKTHDYKNLTFSDVCYTDGDKCMSESGLDLYSSPRFHGRPIPTRGEWPWVVNPRNRSVSKVDYVMGQPQTINDHSRLVNA